MVLRQHLRESIQFYSPEKNAEQTVHVDCISIIFICLNGILFVSDNCSDNRKLLVVMEWLE